MYDPQFNTDDILHLILLAVTMILVMNHYSRGTHIVRNNYIYTKIFKNSEESKIKDFNSPMYEPLIIFDCWLNNIEHLFFYVIPTTFINPKNVKHRIWHIP